PDAVLLVGEQIHVVISGADRAQLLSGHFLEWRHGTGLPRIAFEQRMVDTFVVAAADAEADGAPDIVHDALDGFAKLFAGHVNADGFVAAGDVIADAGGADGVLVGDDAADGHSVALVVVGHEGDSVGGAGAGLNLRNRAFVGLAPNWNAVDELH